MTIRVPTRRCARFRIGEKVSVGCTNRYRFDLLIEMHRNLLDVRIGYTPIGSIRRVFGAVDVEQIGLTTRDVARTDARTVPNEAESSLMSDATIRKCPSGCVTTQSAVFMRLYGLASVFVVRAHLTVVERPL